MHTTLGSVYLHASQVSLSHPRTTPLPPLLPLALPEDANLYTCRSAQVKSSFMNASTSSSVFCACPGPRLLHNKNKNKCGAQRSERGNVGFHLNDENGKGDFLLNSPTLVAGGRNWVYMGWWRVPCAGTVFHLDGERSGEQSVHTMSSIKPYYRPTINFFVGPISHWPPLGTPQRYRVQLPKPAYAKVESIFPHYRWISTPNVLD